MTAGVLERGGSIRKMGGYGRRRSRKKMAKTVS
jgi:hypothetical protein